MKKQCILRIATGLIGLLLLLTAGGYILRNVLLNHVVEQRLASVGKRHELDIRYRHLTLKSINTVLLEGLSIVPHERDTLLTLGSLQARLSLWELLQGNVQIRHLQLDSLAVRFVKHGSEANYDFLFLPTSEADASAPSTTPRSEEDYTLRINKLLDLVFGFLPGNGTLTHLNITEQKDNNYVNLHIPQFNIQDHRFRTDIVADEDHYVQRWQAEGEINPSDRRLSATLHAPHITLPYLKRRLGAEVSFDSLTCRFEQQRLGRELTRLIGQTEVNGLKVYHRRLSPELVNLDHGRLEFHLNIAPTSIELDSTSLVRFNRLDFHPYLKVEQKNGYWHLTSATDKPWFPAEDLFTSLPRGLFDNLDDIRIKGQLAYHFLLDVDFAHLDSLKLESELKGKDVHIESYGHTNLSKMAEEFEYTAYEDDRPVRTFAVGPSWEHFTSLNQIPAILQMAVLQSEDGAFFYHQGFLPDALREALIQDLKVHRFARGGSTISMQLVKNVFLNRNKNIARKLEEALIVWLIEHQRLTSKERMYEVYLNIAEWGPLVYGIHEAADFYFAKRPSELTLEESIYLASIIPKPKHFKNSFTPDGRLKDSQKGYFRLIAQRLVAKGIINEAQAEGVDIANVVLRGPAKESFALSKPEPSSSESHRFTEPE